MKSLIIISKKWRKLSASLLMLNFIFAPILNAFPQEECNDVCQMDSGIHECCTADMNETMGHNCCDMMEMNSKNETTTSTQCGMEISDINCALVLHDNVNLAYIIPKTSNSKVEYFQSTTIDLQKDNYKVELFNITHENSFENKPPIYLTISSFLN